MRIKFCAIVLCFFSFGFAAHADDLFTITGDGVTMTFTLPASPGVAGSDNGGFYLSPISVNINGTIHNQAITFYIEGNGGALSIQNPGQGNDGGTGLVIDRTGEQLFTGSVTQPTFILGTFDLSPANTALFNGDLTLNITSAPAVPEPSSFALLGTGMLGLAGAIKRRLA